MKTGGFTLLELLVVIVVLTLLAGLILVGVNAAISSAKESSTEGMVRAMGGALESYKSQFGDYPPTTLEMFKVKLPNDTHNGIETLVACISTKKQGGPFYEPPNDGSYTNVDRDKSTKNVTDWFFGNNELRELSDSFGWPLFYIHSMDYQKPKAKHVNYISRAAEKKVKVKVFQSDRTKTFANPGRFQLLSPGPDGLFGTQDDIKVW